ncbi:hypothetical protein RD792_005703 [Penstemon davidsonii]|uniref:Small ribosomal subunit protein uS7 domain-containing protein n=1 Tax=Penstemon davidsonii TaxID=160366 RepID=A0ABR0DEG8_9LAMI|nr:hypothetical protein RD792_005703 [Penstemon davidsonii]
MKEGKRTRVRAIVYQTFHRPAQTERDVIKIMVDAVENIKPICEVEKVGVAGTIYDVPGIVARDRQQGVSNATDFTDPQSEFEIKRCAARKEVRQSRKLTAQSVSG